MHTELKKFGNLAINAQLDPYKNFFSCNRDICAVC